MQDNEMKAKSLSLEFGLSEEATTCILTFGCWLDAKNRLSNSPCDIDIKNTMYDMFIESYGRLNRKDSDAYIEASNRMKGE